MLVKCPGCLTTYRVSENLITSNKPAFRCSRCKLIFALELKPKGEPEEASPAFSETIQRSTDSEPDLPFAASRDEATERSTKESDPFTQSRNLPESEGPEPSIPTSLEQIRGIPKDSGPDEFTGDSLTEPSESTPTEQPEQPFYTGPETNREETTSIPEEEPSEAAQGEEQPPMEHLGLEEKEEPPLTVEEGPPPSREFQVTQEEGSEAQSEEALTDFPTQEEREERRKIEVGAHPFGAGGPVSVVPYISLFGLLLLVFSLLTLMHQTQPERLEAYLKPIPWLGPTVLKNKHLRKGLVVGSLRTGYQRVLGNREVFVISGKIFNRNHVSVGEIRVEGEIHTGGGKEIARQAISVGNPISSKIIREMTVREIAILQRLRPQNKFKVAPEGSATFTIVFLKPTKQIKSFSCRVLSAKSAT